MINVEDAQRGVIAIQVAILETPLQLQRQDIVIKRNQSQLKVFDNTDVPVYTLVFEDLLADEGAAGHETERMCHTRIGVLVGMDLFCDLFHQSNDWADKI